MMKAKADYDYFFILDRCGVPVIVIEDLDLGNRSVTNDIENVVNDIGQKSLIYPPYLFSSIVVYKDSDGIWSGWDHHANEFYAVTGNNSEEAIASALEHSIEVYEKSIKDRKCQKR